MSDENYRACIEALDDVTAAFRDGRAEVSSAPTRYEADFAAFKLMQLAWIHVNSLSHIASIPYTGSHIASALVLARSAFETGLTAYWLSKDDDWKEREARWLGWITSEEDYWNNLAKEFETLNPAFSASAVGKVRVLESRRTAITKLLPKDSRSKRPKPWQMLKEVGVEQKYYIFYRITSQVAHGGAGSDEWAVRREDDRISWANVVEPSSWKELFRMASWSIAQPGTVVLMRAGASSDARARLGSCHDKLLEVTHRLERG